MVRDRDHAVLSVSRERIPEDVLACWDLYSLLRDKLLKQPLKGPTFFCAVTIPSTKNTVV